jgi:hypothetical protein
MNEFTTIFEITAGTNGIQADAMFRLFIGVVILTAGITGFVLCKRTQGRFPKRLWAPAFMTFWGVMGKRSNKPRPKPKKINLVISGYMG